MLFYESHDIKEKKGPKAQSNKLTRPQDHNNNKNKRQDFAEKKKHTHTSINNLASQFSLIMASSHSPPSLFSVFCLQPIFYLLLSLFFTLLLASFPHPVASQCKNQPIIFNFGDSNSDTGGLTSGLGFLLIFPMAVRFFVHNWKIVWWTAPNWLPL